MIKKCTFFLSVLCFSVTLSLGQISFSNGNYKLASTDWNSGNCVTVADWNGDGLDDIIRLDQAHHPFIDVQRPNQTFQTIDLTNFDNHEAWGMCVGDVDNNGYKDVAYDVAGNIRLVKTNASGLLSSTLIGNQTLFPQNFTFADFNNDGWIDLFVCDDNAVAKLFMNDGAGNLANSTFVNFVVWPGNCVGPCDGHLNDPWDAGNYGSVWTDFDNDGDMDLYVPHCRQGVDSYSDVRRWNRLFVNDGSNNFLVDTVGATGLYGLMVKNQTWTSSFGDLDNDGDFDAVLTHHDTVSFIMANDGSGHFSNVTTGSGYSIDIPQAMESVFEDFDNDGFVDILVTGNWHNLHRNNGNGTFTEVPGLFNNDNMESFAIGDLNHDGFIDVYGSYATIYNNPSNIDDVIWLNDGNDNHFVNFDLRGTISNMGAIGARVNLYGAWGNQIREVRAGESYGTVNTSILHFGLGTSTDIDSAVIRWPSGLSQTIYNPAADQFIKVIEGDCVSPEASISPNGNVGICPGGTVTLNATTGYSYLWSDGFTTDDSLVVAAEGEYLCVITETGNNCANTPPIVIVEENPGVPPVLTASGALDFCGGNSVTLSVPPDYFSYNWSNGGTSPSITVTAGGDYFLSAVGLCSTFYSDTVSVVVHNAPIPTAMNVNLSGPGTADLDAGVLNVTWYDSVVAGNALGTGQTFTTPVVDQTTVFYAEPFDFFGGLQATGGRMYGSGAYSPNNNTNSNIRFDVHEEVIIKSVKIYADDWGIRQIELRNSSGVTLDSMQVIVNTDSMVVNLNFAVSPGTNYELSTDQGVNVANLGYQGPRLQRHNGGTAYPYNLGSLVTLTGSASGAQFYFYFYDWKVETPTTVCLGARVADTVFVPLGIHEMELGEMQLMPNPTRGLFFIRAGSAFHGNANVSILDIAGREIQSSLVTFISGVSQVSFDISEMPSGIYFVKISKDGIVQTLKLGLEK